MLKLEPKPQILVNGQRKEKPDPNSQINFSTQFRWRPQIYQRFKVKGRDLERVGVIFMSHLRTGVWFGLRTDATPIFSHCMAFLVAVMATVNPPGASWCVIYLIYYNEHIMRLKVYWKFNLPPSWTQLVLTSLCHVLWPYHSFKCCALLPSLLFQPHLIYSTLLPTINHPRVSHKCETQNPLPRTAMGVTNFF